MLFIPPPILPEPAVLAVNLVADSAASGPAGPDVATLIPLPETLPDPVFPPVNQEAGSAAPANEQVTLAPPTLTDMLSLPLPEPLPPPNFVASAMPAAAVPLPRTAPPVARAPARVAPRPVPATPGESANAGAVATPGPATAPAAAPSADLMAAWTSALLDWIDAHRRYPSEARIRAEQGVVTVRFAFDATGKVTSAEVLNGSGSTALDRATLAMLDGARIPAPPEGLEPSRRQVTVPIRYQLNGR